MAFRLVRLHKTVDPLYNDPQLEITLEETVDTHSLGPDELAELLEQLMPGNVILNCQNCGGKGAKFCLCQYCGRTLL